MFRIVTIFYTVIGLNALIVKNGVPLNSFRRTPVVMSTIVSPVHRKEVIPFVIPKGKYLKVTPSKHDQLGRKLTFANKKYADMGIKLRSEYLKLRLLSPEEEKVAGKISFLRKKLDSIRKSLREKLGREPSNQEWAMACRLTESRFRMYLILSQQARNRLIEHNIRLVDFWVRRFLESTKAARDISYYELMTEGIIGLTEAVNNYDGRGKFWYYAQFYIRSAIYRGLNVLRPGSQSTYRNTILNIKAIKIKDALTQQLERKPTHEEIANIMNIKVDTYKSIRDAASKKVVSLETQLSQQKGPNVNTYMDLFLSPNQDTNAYVRDVKLWKSDFKDAFQVLSPIEHRTLAIRYGLMDGRIRTLQTTAELMCLSDEGTRFIIARAIDKLRNSSAAQLFEEGLPMEPITTTSGRMGAMMY